MGMGTEEIGVGKMVMLVEAIFAERQISDHDERGARSARRSRVYDPRARQSEETDTHPVHDFAQFSH